MQSMNSMPTPRGYNISKADEERKEGARDD
jgi:hypothetical protein